jgi:hypothetical protein
VIPERRNGEQGWRAGFAALALGVTALIIYALFSSGFGRPRPTGAGAPYTPAAVAAGFAPRGPTLAVISDSFWLTYLPGGLERSGGGTIAPEGVWARFGTAGRYVEAQVEHGTVAATWDTYRGRIAVLDPRAITVRGKPAVLGRHPGGGRVIVWLERAGTGAWIRVSDSLGAELIAIAASVQAYVGD